MDPPSQNIAAAVESDSSGTYLFSKGQKDALSFNVYMSTKNIFANAEAKFETCKREMTAKITAIQLSMEKQTQIYHKVLARRDGEIKKSDQEKATLKQIIEQKDLRIADLERKINDQHKILENSASRCKNLLDKNKHLNKQTLEMGKEIKTLCSNLDELTEKNNMLTSQKEELSTQYIEIKEDLKDSLVELGKLSQENDGLQSKFKNAVEIGEETRKKTEQELDNTIEKLKAEQTKVTDEQKRNNELVAKIHQLKQSNATLEQDNSFLTKTKADMLVIIKELEDNKRIAMKSLATPLSIALEPEEVSIIETQNTTQEDPAHASKRRKTCLDEKQLRAMEMLQDHRQLYQGRKGNN